MPFCQNVREPERCLKDGGPSDCHRCVPIRNSDGKEAGTLDRGGDRGARYQPCFHASYEV